MKKQVSWAILALITLVALNGFANFVEDAIEHSDQIEQGIEFRSQQGHELRGINR